MPPKYAKYEVIKEERCEAEIEKTMAKLRWENNNNNDQDGNELPREEKKWHDQRTQTMDFQQFRSTNLPFNSRIIAPQQLDMGSETCIQDLKRRLNECTKRYIATNDVKKETNLTVEQQRGLKSLEEKKKRKEIVIFETDKSKRFSCDTIDNYKTLGETHVTNDEVVTAKKVKQFEKEVNAHTEMWIRVLNAGKKTGNYDRIRTSMKSNNNPPAPLSILRKDHKQCEDAFTGPPGRPVCGGDVSYNKRLSHLMSRILTDVYVGERTVCASTEELLAEVDILNERGITNRHIVGSMDVEALYPSLDIDFTIEKVCELLYDSKVDIEGIDYKELSLYLSLVKTDEELQTLGIQEVCPKRRSRRGPRPNITGCGTNEDKEERHKPWIFPDISRIGLGMKRKLLVEAVRVVLKVLLETHTYDFAGEIRRQKEGGAIGMEITGVVAQIFMVWWDKQLINKLAEVNIHLDLHERYVDDTNVATEQTPVGARYVGRRITITEDTMIEDEGIPDDERTMKLLQAIANTIHPSIRVTIDYPSKYNDEKVPMLDLKMWIEECNGLIRIMYEHYEKEIATKRVIHAQSAMPMQVKRTVLTQEMLRILLHCSRDLSWEIVRRHLSNFTMKMQYSGYDHAFRHDVTRSAIDAYRTIRDNEARDLRPVNRPKTWLKPERMEEKERKRKEWYKQGGFDSVLFVSSTPDGKLKRMYQTEIRKSGLRIKVVERTGRTLKSLLQTSNPFKQGSCGRPKCFICMTTQKGNCNTESITYKIECEGETCRKNKYKGESSGNGFNRGKKHISDLVSRNASNSPLWRHCLDEHNGEMQAFQMSITGTYKNDTMLRQIAEAVQIENTATGTLMNDRAEWNMTRVPRVTISS